MAFLFNSKDSSKKSLTGDIKSKLEAEHKEAYGYGFENIYALEKIDLRTVRRIKESHDEPIAEETSSFEEKKCEDLAFDDFYLQPLKRSFCLQEPVHVLDLTSNIQKILLDNHLRTLEDLDKIDRHQWLHIKGIGQGHIDEICEKLNSYLRTSSKLDAIDAKSWLKALIGDCDRKMLFVTLSPYGLAELFTLTLAERATVRQLSGVSLENYHRQMRQELLNEKRKNFLFSSSFQITEGWLKPWMRLRLGFVHRSKLDEYLKNRSTPKSEAVYHFFSNIYLSGSPIYSPHLIQIEKDLFAADNNTAEMFQKVKEVALEYFYRPHLTYPLDDLVSLCRRDLSRQWCDCSSEFFIKVLRYSHLFRTRKILDKTLQISLA